MQLRLETPPADMMSAVQESLPFRRRLLAGVTAAALALTGCGRSHNESFLIEPGAVGEIEEIDAAEPDKPAVYDTIHPRAQPGQTKKPAPTITLQKPAEVAEDAEIQLELCDKQDDGGVPRPEPGNRQGAGCYSIDVPMTEYVRVFGADPPVLGAMVTAVARGKGKVDTD